MQFLLALVILFLFDGLAHGAEIASNELVEKAKAEGEVVWYSTLV